jgi:GR25 family glycosyltransferase involved in LPS biosynthesis
VKVFVINLDRRPDRWAAMSDQLRRLGLECQRVEAIDGLSLDDRDDSLVPSAVDACWRSHQKVYALVAQNAANPNCLVLEDDAVLNSQVNWTAFLRDLDMYMTRELIDVVQLGFLEPIYTTSSSIAAFLHSALSKMLGIVFGRRSDDDRGLADNRWDCLGRTPPGMRLVPDSFLWGTHCYVISRRAAKAFLQVNVPTFTAADSFFVCIAKDQEDYRRFRIARTKRSLALQRSRLKGNILDSDLESIIFP